MAEKIGLVLEGGAMRGIYTAGVLDYLLEQNIEFNYVVGVSAGSGNAVNFVAKQPGRTKKIITHENTRSYYGVGQLFENRKILNLETLVAEYALKDFPFDFDTFFNSKTECECVVANCETGMVEYKGDYKDKEEFLLYNMATCSLPFICGPVKIGDYHYLDGSIIDSIPAQRAIEKGCDKVVVVLTKPEGAKPTDYARMKRMVEWSYKEYPRLCEVMGERVKAYAKQEKYLDKLVKEGKAYIIRPDEQMIKHFENNNERLLECYRYGYDMMQEHMDKMLEFIHTDN